MQWLHGVPRRYDWGSTTAIPAILGREPSSVPLAELWLGAHPSAPSLVGDEDDVVPLDLLVGTDPEACLGAGVRARFGPALPYLLKILAADAPLSLQVHPRADQAEAGFAAEEAAGIARTAPERNYKDSNHKPELIYALTALEALCGFRDPADAAGLLAGLEAPLARSLHHVLETDGEPVRAAVTLLLDPARRPSADQVDAVVVACRRRLETGSPDPAADGTVALLADAHPGDPGVVMSLLLNRVTLAPGEAMFVPAGAVHAYLRGVAVEVMASSDNVLRAGLTTKHTAIDELLASIDYAPSPPHRVVPVAVGASDVFHAPVDEFVLSVTTVDDDGDHRLPGSGPRVLLCLEGELAVASTHGTLTLVRGSSAFVPAAEGGLTVRGRGTLVQADVP